MSTKTRTHKRYLLPTQPYGFHVASLGMSGLVAHLNWGDGITGAILQSRNGTAKGMAVFRPDGWLLPRGVHPEGFQIDQDNLIPYEGDEPIPVQYATPWHTDISDADALQIVRDYLNHAPPYVFISTTRETALGALEKQPLSGAQRSRRADHTEPTP